MVKVKSLSIAKENLRKAAPMIAERNKQGVRGAEWKENAASDDAEALWAAKVAEAAAAKRRQKAIEGVSNGEWRERAMTKGAQQISGAVAASVDKWEDNFRPYAEALEAVDLPARTADPIANVQNRVIPVVQALVDKKKEIKG